LLNWICQFGISNSQTAVREFIAEDRGLTYAGQMVQGLAQPRVAGLQALLGNFDSAVNLWSYGEHYER